MLNDHTYLLAARLKSLLSIDNALILAGQPLALLLLQLPVDLVTFLDTNNPAAIFACASANLLFERIRIEQLVKSFENVRYEEQKTRDTTYLLINVEIVKVVVVAKFCVRRNGPQRKQSDPVHSIYRPAVDHIVLLQCTLFADANESRWRRRQDSPFLHFAIRSAGMVDESAFAAHSVSVDDHPAVQIQAIVMALVFVLFGHPVAEFLLAYHFAQVLQDEQTCNCRNELLRIFCHRK